MLAELLIAKTKLNTQNQDRFNCDKNTDSKKGMEAKGYVNKK